MGTLFYFLPMQVPVSSSPPHHRPWRVRLEKQLSRTLSLPLAPGRLFPLFKAPFGHCPCPTPRCYFLLHT